MDSWERAYKSSILYKLLIKPIFKFVLRLFLDFQRCSQLLLLLEKYLIIYLFFMHLNLLLLEIAKQRFLQPIASFLVYFVGILN